MFLVTGLQKTVLFLSMRFRDFCNRSGHGFFSNSFRRLNTILISHMEFCRKCLHSSLYEKNEDDGLHLNRVPEDVIQPESQKSWVPHPETGVFGPAEQQNWRGGEDLSSPEKSGESVLEQQVWYRPLEDVEKQPYN